MKKWFWRILIWIAVWAAGTGSACRTVWAESLTLYAQSAVLMDGDTGRVLYGREAHTIRPMASTTKIMTCILALEYGNPNDQVKASSLAASQPQVRLGVEEGDCFYLKDLLYSLMLESHNDTAVMVAEHIGGSVENFARMMNQKAKDLGCLQTWFITPNGLDAAETDSQGKERIHSTTARDLARIMMYCIRESPARESFLNITQTQNYSFSQVQGEGLYQCANHNALLSSMEGMVSGKTGFTSGAGYSYVGALESQGRTFIIALLGCGWPPHKTWKWTDASRLFQYGKENYEYRDVFQEVNLPLIPVEQTPPWKPEQSQMGLTLDLPEDEKSLKILMKEGETVQIRLNLPDGFQAPVAQGTQAGTVDYLLQGEILKSYPVYTAFQAEELTPGGCLDYGLGRFLLGKKS